MRQRRAGFTQHHFFITVRKWITLRLKRKSGAGFTAIELLVTIGILGTLAAIGIPSYAHAQQRLIVRQSAAELADVLRQAQTKAIAGVDGSDFITVTITASTVTTTTTVGTIGQWLPPSDIELSPVTLTFARLTGRASGAPTISLTSGSNQTSNVVVTAAGTITAE